MPQTPCRHCDGAIGIIHPETCYKCGRSNFTRAPSAPRGHAWPQRPPPPMLTPHFADDPEQIPLIAETETADKPKYQPRKSYRPRAPNPAQTGQPPLF